MAKEEKKETSKECCSSKENKVIAGFKYGFGIYIAFLTGTVILGLLTSLIWWIFLVSR